MRLTLLPSLASSPDRCSECDDPLDTAGSRCTECQDASVLQRVEWRYQNGEGITPLFDDGRWSISREFHPLHWRIGAGVEFGHQSAGAWVALGPWTLAGSWSA